MSDRPLKGAIDYIRENLRGCCEDSLNYARSKGSVCGAHLLTVCAELDSYPAEQRLAVADSLISTYAMTAISEAWYKP